MVRLQSLFGNKWARIAESFEGRTDNDVKNFWSARKKRLARNHRGPLPSISKNGTGVDGPEQVVTPNEVHIYEVSIFMCLMYCLPAVGRSYMGGPRFLSER